MKRNKFSLSHYKLFSCDMGELIPCGLIEVLPGDTIQMSTSLLVRAQALLAPVMHPLNIRIHHWYVPNRLVWEDWEEFITGGPDGLDASVMPHRLGAGAIGGLHDYMGIAPGASDVYSMLPIRGYQLIWNEFYRDQDLEAETPISVASGVDAVTAGDLKHCDWEKDYFTSSRPWEQKGPAVTLPLGDTAPVIPTPGFVAGVQMKNPDGTGINTISSVAGDGNVKWNAAAGANSPRIWHTTGMQADLSTATAVTVNQLREALAIQRFEEARARYGSRYTEYLRHLGVASSDARLQRPEYLGGGKQTIQFSEVLQTSNPETPAAGNVVGAMKGHGIGAVRSNRFRRFIEEHGFIISLMSARPKTIYANSMNRMWNRKTKLDYWQQELEMIGQQEVLNKEVYSASATPTEVFGYQDRYDEYRRQESTVAGEFRSTLNFWHMARDFTSQPALNADFVKCVPTERTFSVPSSDVLAVMARHSIQARRLVAKTGRSKTF